MMAMALTLLNEGDTSRCLFLLDTFEEMSEPTDQDRDNSGFKARQQLESTPPNTGVWCYASLEEVQSSMASSGYPIDKIHFIKGKVEDTIRCHGLDSIAVLRLDTDWYESTRHELEHLYPLLSQQWALIIDDYGHWPGARQAVDEFLTRHPDESLFLHPIDYTGRIAIKPSASSRG